MEIIFNKSDYKQLREYITDLITRSFTGEDISDPITIIVKSQTVDKNVQFVINTLMDDSISQAFDYACMLETHLIPNVITSDDIAVIDHRLLCYNYYADYNDYTDDLYVQQQYKENDAAEKRTSRKVISQILGSNFDYFEPTITLSDFRNYYLKWVK